MLFNHLRDDVSWKWQDAANFLPKSTVMCVTAAVFRAPFSCSCLMPLPHCFPGNLMPLFLQYVALWGNAVVLPVPRLQAPSQGASAEGHDRGMPRICIFTRDPS